MKLLYCPACQDVVKLRSECPRACYCGQSWGNYLPDGLHAQVGGKSIPLGFANGSLYRAMRNRPESGRGERFEAFVIPVDCPTVEDR